VIKRALQQPGVVLWAVFLWKIALLVLTAQPVPSNDAYFYDGAVVNFLLHGKYCNPSLALALPISGLDVFCAYPPLYQVILWAWMSLFGTSVIAAMALHVILFGVYLAILFASFRRLSLPPWALNAGSAFVLVITFHDRPDSLAHVFGMAAVYCWIRSCHALGKPPHSGHSAWSWAMTGFAVLSLCTGLQIGALYFLLLGIGMLAARYINRAAIPWAPLVALVLIPVTLIARVVFGFPHLWAGFLEHARQTPALSGWRIPKLGETLKAVRTVPGILATGIGLLYSIRMCVPARNAGKEMLWTVALTCTLAALVMTFASMFVLTANAVSFSAYLQPLAVACYLGMVVPLFSASGMGRLTIRLFIGLAALGSIRAIGMTTWGIACARDVSQRSAIHRVRAEVQRIGKDQAAVFSGAYLHEAAPYADFRWIHSDWLAPAKKGENDFDRKALIRVKPVKLLLTQFDYYRRYQPVLESLKSQPDIVAVEIIDTARVPPPDSIKSLQRVVQHISWAPIIVNLTWK
jgi:hypothetical protein